MGLSLLTALGGGATFYWFTETRAFEVLTAHAGTSLGAVAVVATITTVNPVLRWLRWGFLLRRFHVRVPTRETFQIYFATLPAALTPLYLGELVRARLVAGRRRSLGRVVCWVWLVERCSDAAALVALWGAFTARILLLAAGAAALLSCPWLLARITLRREGAGQLHTGQLRPAMTVAVCASLSLLAWTLPAVSARWLLHVLGAPVDGGEAVEAFVRGTLLGGLSGVPGGAGVMGAR